MRKNRKTTKRMSVLTANMLHFGAIVMMLFVMVILNLLASSSCSQLMKSIGEKDRKLDRLEEARQRESARWEQMKTPERLETALLKHGLSMKYPRPNQVVKMKADGTPYVGQVSVCQAKQRQAAASYAKLSLEQTPPVTRRSTVRPAVRKSRYYRVR